MDAALLPFRITSCTSTPLRSSIRLHPPTTLLPHSPPKCQTTLPCSVHPSLRTPRPSCPRPCSALGGTPDALVLEAEAERARLKQELLLATQACEGSLNEECMEVISRLEKLNPNPDVTVAPELLKGCFVQVRANFKNTGRPGEKEKSLGYMGALGTLGRTTFNMLKPVELEIALYDTYLHVGIESDDAYNFIIEFDVPNAGKDSPLLQGLIINRGRYSLGDSNRLDVDFLSCGMVPRHPEDLPLWLEIFRGANPGMDESGSVVLPLPMPAQGWTGFLYLDNEIRVTKGNRGGVAVLRQLREPVVSI